MTAYEPTLTSFWETVNFRLQHAYGQTKNTEHTFAFDAGTNVEVMLINKKQAG